MRFFLTIILFLISWVVVAQKQEADLLQRMKRFHEIMVQKRFYIDQYLDDSLSYGHSNGWVESKNEFVSNLGSKIVYHSFKEDSIKISINKKIAYARFVAAIDATLDGKQFLYRLKVLEVWVKRRNSWKIFARQAVK